MSVSVKRPDRRLLEKIGASATSLLPTSVRLEAEASVRSLEQTARASLGARLAEIETLLAGATTVNCRALFALAHDIRGVAGTFSWRAMGELADTMCLYLDDLNDEAPVNAALLRELSRALRVAFESPQSPEGALLSAECRAAVRVVRVREGRTPDLG